MRRLQDVPTVKGLLNFPHSEQEQGTSTAERWNYQAERSQTKALHMEEQLRLNMRVKESRNGVPYLHLGT